MSTQPNNSNNNKRNNDESSDGLNGSPNEVRSGIKPAYPTPRPAVACSTASLSVSPSLSLFPSLLPSLSHSRLVLVECREQLFNCDTSVFRLPTRIIPFACIFIDNCFPHSPPSRSLSVNTFSYMFIAHTFAPAAYLPVLSLPFQRPLSEKLFVFKYLLFIFGYIFNIFFCIYFVSS